MNCFFVEQQIHHSLKSLSRITVLLAMLLCVSWRTKILLGKSTFRWLSRKLSKWSNNMLAPDMNILIQTCYVLLCFLEINHNLSDTFELVLAEHKTKWITLWNRYSIHDFFCIYLAETSSTAPNVYEAELLHYV